MAIAVFVVVGLREVVWVHDGRVKGAKMTEKEQRKGRSCRLVGGEGRELIYAVCKPSPELPRRSFFFSSPDPSSTATGEHVHRFPVIGIQRPRTEFCPREGSRSGQLFYLQKRD